MPDMGSLMAMLGNGGGLGGGLSAPQPVANPEEAFATQLTQLEVRSAGLAGKYACQAVLDTQQGDLPKSAPSASICLSCSIAACPCHASLVFSPCMTCQQTGSGT